MKDTPTVINTTGLTKTHGSVSAVEDLGIEVPNGSIYGLLGPNGAGKSTTIDMLVGLVHPSAGSAQVLGREVQSSPVAIRRRTGVLLDGFTPFATLTGGEHVSLVASANGIEAEPESVLDRVGLAGAVDQPAGEYSQGMTRRLGLAMALVGEPELLILDEPTAGLDPGGKKILRRIIQEENDRGATVFFSSHDLPEVKAVCDRVGILNEGRLVAENDIRGLTDAVQDEAVLLVRLDPSPSVLDRVRNVDGVRNARFEDDELVVGCETESVIPRILTAIDRGGGTVDSFEKLDRSLERAFESYTGEGPE